MCNLYLAEPTGHPPLVGVENLSFIMGDPVGGPVGPPPPGNDAVPRWAGGLMGASSLLSSRKDSRQARLQKPLATNNQLADYYAMYKSDQHFDKYFSITSIDNAQNLSEIDTVKANEHLVRHLGGHPANIRELRSGGISIEVKSKEQSQAIRSLKELAGCKISVKSNDNMNQCKGTIYYRNGPRYDEEQILNAININSEIRATNVYRQKKRVEGQLTELPIYIITFQSTQLPSHVCVGWTRCSTRLYVPRPRRCYNCQSFGHGSKTCRKQTRTCAHCGETYENEGEHITPCKKAPQCSNCGDAHPASSFECSYYKAEQQILDIQAKERLTYSTAKKRINFLKNQTESRALQTYASAVGGSTPSENRRVAETPSKAIRSPSSPERPRALQTPTKTQGGSSPTESIKALQTYASAAGSPSPQRTNSQDKPQSQVIKTKQYHNSTFTKLGKETNRKRNLSDPSNQQQPKHPNRNLDKIPLPRDAPPQHSKNKPPNPNPNLLKIPIMDTYKNMNISPKKKK